MKSHMDLLDKIRKIEALIEGAKTEGERNAAISAKNRIHEKLLKSQPIELKEYALYTQGNWHKKLLLAICRKHGIRPYRYKRQKYTTVMVRINEKFLNDVLWPEYLEYSQHLEELVEGITNSIIEKIHKDEDEDIVQGQLK
ncbi:MAG: hypothetical protein AAF804_06405 [Bacteroidota bacterium]